MKINEHSRIKFRNTGVLDMIMAHRKAGTMKDRRTPRGGAKMSLVRLNHEE